MKFEVGEKVTKADYLHFFRGVMAPYEEDFPDKIIDYCIFDIQGELVGAVNPGALGRWAYLESSMHRFTGEDGYLRRARDLIMHVIEAIKKTPKQLWDFIDPRTPEGQKKLVEAYKNLEVKVCHVGGFSRVLPIALACRDLEATNAWESGQQRETVREVVAELVDHMISPSNRYSKTNVRANNKALTRARGVMVASKVFADHPHSEQWRKWAEQVISYSLNRPSDEDALNYQSDWFHSILDLIELLDLGEQAYFTPYHRAYFEHYKQMVTPSGMGIGYGDGWDNPSGILPILEKGATVFRDGVYKHLATQHFRRYAPELLSHTPDKHDIHVALWRWIDAYRWADDSIEPIPPPVRSTITCERKVVLKSGKSLLALTSDEGRIHGHFDANAIAKLVHNGNMLMTDGGYRWPEAVNHNRFLWREGKPKGPILDHFRPLKTKPYRFTNEKGRTKMIFSQPGPPDGVERNWHPASEESIKIQFLTDFPEFTAVRSALGPQTRTIVLDRRGRSLVFDHLKTEKTTTAACVYYVPEVVANGNNWARGRMDTKQPRDLLMTFLNPDIIQMEPQVRAKRMQTAVYSSKQGSFPYGTWFVSALLPLNRQSEPQELVRRLQHRLAGTAVIVTFNDTDKTITYCCQIGRQLIELPGGVETDAELVRLKETEKGLHASIVNGTMLQFEGEKVLSLPFPANLQTRLVSRRLGNT